METKHYRIYTNQGREFGPDWYVTEERVQDIALGLVCGMWIKGAQSPRAKVFEVLEDGTERIFYTQRM